MLWNTTFPQFYMYMHMLKDKERFKKKISVHDQCTCNLGQSKSVA